MDNPNATGSALNMVPSEFDNRTSLIIDPPDGRLPALTPEGQRRVAENQAAGQTTPWQFGQAPRRVQHPPPAHATDLSNLLRCITWGVPKIAGNIDYTSHYQIFQGPGYVVLLSEVNHEARVIPLDGRAHCHTTSDSGTATLAAIGKATRSSSRRRTSRRRATSWARRIACISPSVSRARAPTRSTTR